MFFSLCAQTVKQIVPLWLKKRNLCQVMWKRWTKNDGWRFTQSFMFTEATCKSRCEALLVLKLWPDPFLANVQTAHSVKLIKIIIIIFGSLVRFLWKHKAKSEPSSNKVYHYSNPNKGFSVSDMPQMNNCLSQDKRDFLVITGSNKFEEKTNTTG